MAHSSKDQEPMVPSGGRWVWRDETNTLEWISHNPADRHDRKKDRKQKNADNRGRASPTQGKAGPFNNVVKDRIGIRGTVGQRVISGRTHHHKNVKIGDIKIVACDMTGEENLSAEFNGLYDTTPFDDFLYCLINYFHWFFEKQTAEEKPTQMSIEPSRREREHYADLLKKLDIALKVLGQAWCVLVIGEGIQNQHHMGCGTSRVSNTYRDRDMYETLYIFCSYFVWIAFRRNKDYELVKKELNRLLRSETFNPAIRIKNAPDQIDPNTSQEEVKLTPAEYRRKQGNRPPIKSIIDQRSPALVSILPTPKEESPWLFKSHGKEGVAALSSHGAHEETPEEERDRYAHLNIEFDQLKKGIIGEPLVNFNMLTLSPKGAGTEETEEEEAKSDERKGSVSAKIPIPGERRMSREPTGISDVTHEGLPENEE